MKNTIAALLALLVLSCKGEPKQELPEKNIEKESAKYELVWQDEFDVTGAVDSTKWNFEKGLIRNHEKQYYTNNLKNVRVEGGFLILEAHKEQIANDDFVSADIKDWKKNQDYAQYTAASVTTKDLAEWTYGKIEVRAKLPKGRGLWPAIWMLGENWKELGWPECGEIDIMEHVGYSKDSIFGTVHTQAFNHMKGTEVGKSIFIENPYSEFHDYAVEWSPERIDFILDGKKYHEFINNGNGIPEWPFDQAFHLKLNVAVGGDWGGQQGIDDPIFPRRMLIDYARVYQLK